MFLGPRVWGVLSAGMAVLVASGCGSGSHDPKMIVTYEKASTGPAIIGRAMMTRTHLLDDLADKINHTLHLPYDIALVGAQCGEANAFWNLAEKKITICYEDADLSLRAFKAAGDSDPIPAAVNAELATFYHEFAHAAIDFDELPITGREEDASDQLVVFLLLEPDENGKVEPRAEEAVKDYARLFEQYAAGQEDLVDADFAAKHSVHQTRMYNVLCWMYGHDTVEHADIVTDGLLPESRADGCEDEYKQLARSWSKLLAPYQKHK